MGFSANIGITSTAPGVVRVAMRGVIRFPDVEQLRVQIDELIGNGLGMVTGIVVDLSAVQACDCRALPVLHVARRRMIESCGWLVVRGVDPRSLTGFAAIGLADAIAVYRASRVLAEPVCRKNRGGRMPPAGSATPSTGFSRSESSWRPVRRLRWARWALC